MIGTIVKLPFTLLKLVLGTVFKSLHLVMRTGLGTARFVSSRVFGSAFGALAGLMLGNKHVGVKVFTHRKKPKKSA
jgi:hypothetical protein